MASIQPRGSNHLSQRCQICGASSVKTFTCIQCNSLAFCDPCWSKWILHAPGAIGWGGKPHEKADPEVIERLRQIFEPTRTEADHELELAKDRETTWFGFSRDSSGHPIFQDYGRLATIMNESQADVTTDRYPQIVSFIGETGAGKSTLIKLLIDRQSPQPPESVDYFSPVTSSSNDYIPTTGDVHLYAEPSTSHTNTPLLFADCEGFNGGEALPKALRCLPQEGIGKGRLPAESPGCQHPFQRNANNTLLRSRHSSQRHIVWANSPQTKKREYSVSQLYPRILFTFSDTVVFVLRNPRSFESTVLNKLVRWGAASVDKSLNQPILPHAIVVLDATEDVDEKEWDVVTATNRLMSAIQGAIAREPALDEYVQTWRRCGKEIRSTDDLLKHYYASVTVIRVPRRGSYMLMDQQVEKLSDLIKRRCSDSHLKKKQVRMLANADMLQVYLHASFDHFTKDLESPFDFVKEALGHNPVSRSFEGNILHLAVSMKDHSNNKAIQNDAKEIFQRLAPMIASCVMFDAVRQNRLGTAAQLLENSYSQLCVSALQAFADLYWPCRFRNPAYSPEKGRCCNVRSGHNPKGHQNQYGKIIGHGQYQSEFDPSAFIPVWNGLIQDNLIKLQTATYELGQKLPEKTDLQISSIIHRERITSFYAALGNPLGFVSHSACFSCLRGLPECVLPCGHILCLACVRTYGHSSSKTRIELRRCPLHVREIMVDPPWVITTKPLHAGVRVLCLDSGGIDGIVELKVLQAIERVLGPKLPIRNFFDLIVGTSAGAVIALGLGVKGWSVNKTTREFKALYKEAFTPRKMIGIPLLGTLSSTYYGSVYKMKPLEAALRKGFTNRSLFGGIRIRNEMPMKIAVTSTNALKSKAVVLSNYNRPDPPSQSIPYEFVRPGEPSKEMKIWEVARATTAAIPYFKPFQKAETKDQYIDSSPHNACPIWVAHEEMKLIWSDVADSPPDIMLSIGTGEYVRDRHTPREGRSSFSITDASSVISTASTKPIERIFTRFTGQEHKNDISQMCKQTWDKFKAGKFTSGLSGEWEDNRRYLRISPELDIPVPKFDDIHRIDEIEREAEEALQQNRIEIKEVVHQLIASTFYFEKDLGPLKQTSSGYTCKGSIFCRFRKSSDEMKGLGNFLRSRLKGGFEPHFLIEDDMPGSTTQHVVLTETAIRDMCHQGYFDMEPIDINALKEHAAIKITLCLQTDPYPSGEKAVLISGFPRQLMCEDVVNTERPYMPLSSSRDGTSRMGEKEQNLDPETKEMAPEIVDPASKISPPSEIIAELSESTAEVYELPSEEVQKPHTSVNHGLG
ncbi:hypothetical protein F4804DRAFT_348064 [Jackrogersella minutella]|nr:hypothetical protein F4804DRAFT_348064 [Jackrogersella minutella]